MISIYKITNTENNKVYVGQTSLTLKRRMILHKTSHINGKDKLHSEMRRIGIDKFNISLITQTELQEEANLLESKYIDIYDSINNGYNTINSGFKNGGNTYINNPNKNEIIDKLSKSKIGCKNPMSRKIKSININTNETKNFNSLEDCVRYYGFSGHQGISRRLNKKVKTPYLNTWLFEYI